MELNLSDAKDLDKVLLFLSEQKDGVYFTIQEIASSVFDVSKIDHVKWLIEQLMGYRHEIIKELMVHYKGTGHFSKGNYTSRILDEGGFESIYNKALEEHKKHQERIYKQDQVMNLTIEDLVDKIIDQPRYKNRLLRAEIISGVSALAAVGSMIAAIALLKGC
jgi:hypothetical protein